MITKLLQTLVGRRQVVGSKSRTRKWLRLNIALRVTRLYGKGDKRRRDAEVERLLTAGQCQQMEHQRTLARQVGCLIESIGLRGLGLDKLSVSDEHLGKIQPVIGFNSLSVNSQCHGNCLMQLHGHFHP